MAKWHIKNYMSYVYIAVLDRIKFWQEI